MPKCPNEKHGYDYNCSLPECYECSDPDCDEWINENTLDWEIHHHYGCGCEDCMLYYYLYLK
jgi:hypothetical protein